MAKIEWSAGIDSVSGALSKPSWPRRTRQEVRKPSTPTCGQFVVLRMMQNTPKTDHGVPK